MSAFGLSIAIMVAIIVFLPLIALSVAVSIRVFRDIADD